MGQEKKTSSKAPFSIAMLVYQRIAVGLSKIIVFVCLILPLEFFWIRKITPAKCRDSGGKPECFGMVLIVLAGHSCVTSCLVFGSNQFLSMLLLWVVADRVPRPTYLQKD